MTTRVLNTRLCPELAWPGHHRKTEKVGEAVADLHRLTLEAFSDAHETVSAGFVIVTLYATTPRADGYFRPRLSWMVGFGTYPILQALYDARLITAEVWPIYRREWVRSADEERIEIEIRTVEQAAA